MTPNEISEFARAIGTVYDGEAAPPTHHPTTTTAHLMLLRQSSLS